MKSTTVAWLLGLLTLSIHVPFPIIAGAAETKGAAGPLAAAREGCRRLAAIEQSLRTSLESRQAADRASGAWTELRLELAGAADHDDALAVLRRTGNRWQPAYVQVPGWSQSTMPEWRGFYLGNGTGGDWRGGLAHPADAVGLRWTDGRLSGPLQVTYGYDQTISDRQPPGTWLTYWDRFVPSGNARPRKVVHEIEVAIEPGAWLIELVIEDGVRWPISAAKKPPKGGQQWLLRPVVLRLQLPSSPLTPVKVTTPTWNGGFHEADASQLRFRDGKLTGELTVWLHQDGWGPWGGGKTWQVAPLTVVYGVNAAIAGGRVVGQYDAEGKKETLMGYGEKDGVTVNENPMGKWSGRIVGTAGQLATGRHRTSGDLGERMGTVVGMALAVEPLGPAPSANVPNDVPGLAGMAGALAAEIRALHLALTHPGLPLDEARRQTAVAQPAWGDQPDPAAVADFARQAVAWCASPADEKSSRARPESDVGRDSPSLGTRALEIKDGVAVLGSAGGWFHWPVWQMVGPFGQRFGPEQDAAALAEVVPATGVRLIQSQDRLGANIAGAEPLTWTTVLAEGPTVFPPVKQTILYTRFNGSIWYATARLRTEATVEACFALESGDGAQAFLDGRPIWSQAMRAWRTRPAGRHLVPVRLEKGEHTLLVRLLHDRNASWFQLAISPRVPAPGKVADTLPAAPSSGNPPLAWDLAGGRNVAWRNEALAGSRRPLVQGGRLFVTAGNHLHAVDPATGKVLWVRALGEAAAGKGQPSTHAPVGDGAHVYAQGAAGTAFSFTPEGVERWKADTGLANGVISVLHDRVVVEGVPGQKGKSAGTGVVALDAATGKETGRWKFAAAYDPAHAAAIVVPGAKRTHGAYLCSAGMLIDVLDDGGTRRLDIDWPGSNDDGSTRYGPGITSTAFTYCQYRDRLFVCSQTGIDALQFWPGPDGRLAYGMRWMVNLMVSGFFGFPAAAVCDGERLHVWHALLSHGPHCPDPFVELYAYDAQTGAVVDRLARIHLGRPHAGMGPRIAPALAQGRLYLLESGGGDAGDGTVSVVGAGPNLKSLANNAVDRGTSSLVVAGDRLVLRSEKGLFAVVLGGDGRRWQAETVARTLLRHVGPPPLATAIPRPKPITDLMPDINTPVTVFLNGLSPTCWIGAGPFAPGELPGDEVLAALRPRVGDALRSGGSGPKFQPLTRAHAYRDPPRYKRQHELQGTGDIVPVFSAHLDPSALAGPNGSALFYALIDAQRDRLVLPRLKGRGLTLWVSGHKAAADHPLYLSPGLHPVLLRVDPEHFLAGAREDDAVPPVDVDKALAAGKLKPVWPAAWRVAGPVPADLPPLEGDALRSVPADTLSVAGHAFRTFDVPIKNNAAMLLGLMDLLPGQPLRVDFDQDAYRSNTLRIGMPHVAYAYGEIDVPADGVLYVAAASQGSMKWHLDGTAIQVAPTDSAFQPFAVRLSKGKHVLCIAVGSEARAWSLTSVGGFSAAPDSLAEFRVTPKLAPPAPDVRVDPALVELPLLEGRLEHWRRRATAARAELEAILRELPATPYAEQAQRLLEAIKAE
ncbi:MAG: PQQ-binding-like beta-propeller repeat protein [Thermoguttaceae bacterium]